jgi:hypothetical protein
MRDHRRGGTSADGNLPLDSTPSWGERLNSPSFPGRWTTRGW